MAIIREQAAGNGGDKPSASVIDVIQSTYKRKILHDV
jgi:hypothetical protein